MTQITLPINAKEQNNAADAPKLKQPEPLAESKQKKKGKDKVRLRRKVEEALSPAIN